jgi:hypothetical protein
MTLAIMQPYFFPYLGYFHGIAAVDKYILYDQLAYIKEGWIHRNRYLGVGGPAYFVARTRSKSSFAKIGEIELFDHPAWRKKILHAFLYNYRTRPFFDEVFPVLERVVNAEAGLLTDLCALSIQEVCAFLEIPTEVSRDPAPFREMEEKLAANEADLPALFPAIRLEAPERKVYRAIAMCQIERTDTYVNAIGGQALYRKEEFRRNGIALHFVQTRPHPYPQSTRTFYPNLSILDVLMNCGKQGTQLLLREYDLV